MGLLRSEPHFRKLTLYCVRGLSLAIFVGRQGEDAIDESLATALQRNMSFADDRKRQHTPSTANRYSLYVS